MCYKCGCGELDDDMGNPKNLTNKTVEEAAKAAKQTAEEGKRNTYEALKKQFEWKKPGIRSNRPVIKSRTPQMPPIKNSLGEASRFNLPMATISA
jgi:hypothetical protein